MDSMMKLRLMDNLASFVFLGQIFPLIDWKTIAAVYRLADVFDGLYQISPSYITWLDAKCTGTSPRVSSAFHIGMPVQPRALGYMHM